MEASQGALMELTIMGSTDFFRMRKYERPAMTLIDSKGLRQNPKPPKTPKFQKSNYEIKCLQSCVIILAFI